MLYYAVCSPFRQTEDRGSPHGTHWHPRDICDTAHAKPRQWTPVAYPGILFGGRRGVQQIQLRTEDRENGNLGAVAPLVRGSGGSCNLVQEISFHIVKFFLIFGTLRLFMMTIYLSLLM